MWADHAEIPKAWCKAAADELIELRDILKSVQGLLRQYGDKREKVAYDKIEALLNKP